MFTRLALMAIAVLSVAANANIPPQAQASTLAVPFVAAPAPSSVLVVITCNQLTALVVVDEDATIHPVSLEGLSTEGAKKIMQLVPADRVIGINVGCPGDNPVP